MPENAALLLLGLALPPRPQPQAEVEPETQHGNIGATTKLDAIATEAEAVEGERPQFERSPFLPEALKDQIRSEAAAAAEAAARQQSFKSLMQGMHFAERIYPRRQRPQPAADMPASSVQPAVEVVEPDPREIEQLEELVEPFCPLTLDLHHGTTQEAVREALRLGKSQNWITANLFRVRKGTKDYETAVGIVKAIREEQGHVLR